MHQQNEGNKNETSQVSLLSITLNNNLGNDDLKNEKLKS